MIDFVLGPEEVKEGKFLGWPPDAFAIAGHLLQLSGAYTEVVKNCPPGTFHGPRWQKDIEKRGEDWRRKTDVESVPKQVKDWWAYVLRRQETALSEIWRDRKLWRALLSICAAADAACIGVGVAVQDVKRDFLSWRCTDLLRRSAINQVSSTLCQAIHPSKLSVLPKMHTPQKGITFRSLSHNLALCAASDVKVNWTEAIPLEGLTPRPESDHAAAVLIVPYPLTVEPSQFGPARPPQGNLHDMDEQFGFFEFVPTTTPERFIGHVLQLCKKAKRKVGRLDGVIFPEMALEPNRYQQVRNAVFREGVSFLISGVYKPAANHKPAWNYAQIALKVVDKYFIEVEQQKHHRWFLEDNQICQYGLGSTLNPNRRWWEYTSLHDRSLTFLSLNSWLTISVLICEDLARPDPVGNLLRAVGPNLVVALLQDGPQLTSRWSARCASVLADDPGSSVLTLTSAGMAQLSSPVPASSVTRPPQPVIALWKDRATGFREIPLAPGAEAMVLSLTHTFEKEWTADGRHDHGGASVIKLAGVHAIGSGERTSYPRRRPKRN